MRKIIICFLYIFSFFFTRVIKSEELLILKDKILLDESEIQFGRVISNVTFDSKNNIIISESMPPSIHMFNAKGKYIKTMAKYGEGPSELSPTATSNVSISTNGDIYIASSNNTLKKYDPQGNLINSMLLEGKLKNLFISKKGNLFSYRISGVKKGECVLREVILKNKKILDKNCLLKRTGKGIFQGFSVSFFSLDFDSDSNIYAIEGMDYTICKFDSKGNLIKKFAHPGKAYIPLQSEPPIPLGRQRFSDWNKSFSKILQVRVCNNKYVIVFYVKIQVDDMDCDVYTTNGQYIASSKVPAGEYPAGKDNNGNLCTIKREVNEDGTVIKTWIYTYSVNEKFR